MHTSFPATQFIAWREFSASVYNMHRQNLLQQLTRYKHRYPDEADCIDRFITFVTSSPDCFNRSHAAGHVTGSAWIVNQAGTHTLLTHHKKLDKWLQLGGHADGNPNVLAVALQEAREESGLSEFQTVSDEIFDLDIHLIPARHQIPAHSHYDVRFALRADDGIAYQVSDESHDLTWIAIAALHILTREESMLRMARKWMRFFPQRP